MGAEPAVAGCARSAIRFARANDGLEVSATRVRLHDVDLAEELCDN